MTPNPYLADLFAAAFREDRAGINAALDHLTEAEERQFARVIRIIVEEQFRRGRAKSRRRRGAGVQAEVIRDESITCPRCGMTSYNPNDIREGYCGNCHDWTGQDRPWITRRPLTG